MRPMPGVDYYASENDKAEFYGGEDEMPIDEQLLVLQLELEDWQAQVCGAAIVELARYKRLEAILRDRSDVVDVPDTYNEVRANAEMQALQDWENGE